jgi:hypothetical protein
MKDVMRPVMKLSIALHFTLMPFRFLRVIIIRWRAHEGWYLGGILY